MIKHVFNDYFKTLSRYHDALHCQFQNMDAQLCNASNSGDVESHMWKLNASSVRFQEMCTLLLQWLRSTNRNMDSELYKAVVCGDVASVMSKFDASLLFFLQTTAQKDTLLHIAARNGQEELVNQLLSMLRNGNRKFCIAVTVFSLFSFGTLSFRRAKNVYGNTALHEAAKASHAGVISTLLKYDKSMRKMVNKYGERPLSVACIHGNLDSIQQFLDDEGFRSIKKKRKDGQTCLHLAALRGNAEAVKLVVEGSKEGMQSLDTRDTFGATPLHSAVEGGNPSVVEYILQKNPNLAYKFDALGRAPVHLAALKGDFQIIKTIVKERPDCIDMTTKEGKTILHFAVQSQELELVQWISSQEFYRFGGDESDKNGNLPLHLAAVYFADEQMVKILLHSFPRCNVNAVNNEGFTCLDIVRLGKSSSERPNEVEKYLRKAGASAPEEVKDRDVLNTPEEQKERYSRMIQTNAVIAALFASFAVTGPTKDIKDRFYFTVYMMPSNIAFYSSMTVILVWILLEPFSRTRESSWIQGSMYILGFGVLAAALSFSTIMFNHLAFGIKGNAERYMYLLEALSTAVIPVATMIWICGRTLWSYYKAKRERKVYIAMTIKRSASRLLAALFVTTFLALVYLLSNKLSNKQTAFVGFAFALLLLIFPQRISLKMRITVYVALLLVLLCLMIYHPFKLPPPSLTF